MLKKALPATIAVLTVGLTMSPSARGAPGIEIYANGSSYWTQTGFGWTSMQGGVTCTAAIGANPNTPNGYTT